MWQTNTYWFDVAVVMSIFAFGNICFGHFEEHKPKLRRVLKVVIVLAIVLGLAITVGRAWAYGVLALPLLGAVYIHLRWLPQHGSFNGLGLDRRAKRQVSGVGNSTPQVIPLNRVSRMVEKR